VINAEDITLYYNSKEEVGDKEVLNIWSASMQLTAAAFVVKQYDLE